MFYGIMHSSKEKLIQSNVVFSAFACYMTNAKKIQIALAMKLELTQASYREYYKNNLYTWPVWLNGSVFVYELSGCGFESSCSHSNILGLCSGSKQEVKKVQLSYIIPDFFLCHVPKPPLIIVLCL